MMDEITISIANDFTEFPGGRFPEDGPYNGTTFRNEHLVPHLREGKSVVVSFDGVAGFGSSFLEEAFGGLVRENHFRENELNAQLKLVSSDDEFTDFIEIAWEFIRGAVSEQQ